MTQTLNRYAVIGNNEFFSRAYKFSVPLLCAHCLFTSVLLFVELLCVMLPSAPEEERVLKSHVVTTEIFHRRESSVT